MHSISRLYSQIRVPPPRSWVITFVLYTLIGGWWGPATPHHGDLVTTSVSGSDTWVPPLSGATQSDIVQPFIAPQQPWSAAHRGVDLLADNTSEVIAPAPGEVTFVGTVVDRPVVTIRHSDGLLSSFEPVESDLQVGQTVSQGHSIGNISADKNHCDSACLHWGVRKPDAWLVGSTVRDLYLDPAFLLGWTEPSVLWPIHSDPAP